MIKATLFGMIVVSLAAMWSSRTYVTDAYETTPNTLQLRLSGIDLAVTKSEIEPSPFDVPAAPDTRHRPPPARSTSEPAEAPATVALDGGTATLRGVVSGPSGPIPGALVGVERHTSHGIGSTRLTTDEAGNWSIGRLPGGRYRVRAWVPNLMTMGGSEVRFLADGQALDFDFSLWGVDPSPTMEFIDGGPIYRGLLGTVAVAISQRTVDAEGFIVTTPTAGLLVAVQVSSEMTLVSNPLQFTDSQGAARFILACIPAIPGVPTTDAPMFEAGREPTGSVLSGQTIVGASAIVSPSSPSSPGATGASASPTGTISAQAGALADSFSLPGCQPIPDPGVDTAVDAGPDGHAGG